MLEKFVFLSTNLQFGDEGVAFVSSFLEKIEEKDGESEHHITNCMFKTLILVFVIIIFSSSSVERRTSQGVQVHNSQQRP